jgi:hypothetical protein
MNLPKWIWQQTNEVSLGKTNSCRSTHFAKHTLVKSHTCKGKKINQQMVKLNQTHYSYNEKNKITYI